MNTKKNLIIFFLFFFILINSYTFLQGTPASKGTIITVDNDGDGDYTTITEAVLHAGPGDTIEVYSGTYNERLINITSEDLTLQGIAHELGNGTDTGRPFIDGGGLFWIISVMAPNVTITRFRMENQGETATILINIEKSALGCTISENALIATLESFASDIKVDA